MTDYAEEQSGEIEALESIYTGELEVLEVEPHHKFELPVKGEFRAYDVEIFASCMLQFTYTATYPDEAPVIEVTSVDNLEDEHVQVLMDVMTQEAQDNLGMVMIFSLVSACQERLNDLVEEIAVKQREQKELALEAAEEVERKKFEGTRVSIETFLAWKAKFDAEMAEIKRQKGYKDPNAKKKSGYELFMEDHTLDDSDVKFLEQDGDNVQVDESLFQDLDDLDLDAELELSDS